MTIFLTPLQKLEQLKLKMVTFVIHGVFYE